jgi:hypothetical protein
MTLVISKGLTLAKANNGIVDPDAIIYINNVEKVDGENLEYDTAKAIHDFVVGCKADGIWNAIKASCILAGARTLTGALVPLAGPAPINTNFVSGDYNRKTGLKGDTSTKYLDTNRDNSLDPQDSNHSALWISELPTISGRLLNTADLIGVAGMNTIATNAGITAFNLRSRSSTATVSQGTALGNSFVGINRSNSTGYTFRSGSTNSSITQASAAPAAGNTFLYKQAALYIDPRLAFYSIGESLDLALLDARVTDLINAFAAAIP